MPRKISETLGAIFAIAILVAFIAGGIYTQVEAQENPEEYCRSPYARNDLRCVGSFPPRR